MGFDFLREGRYFGGFSFDRPSSPQRDETSLRWWWWIFPSSLFVLVPFVAVDCHRLSGDVDSFKSILPLMMFAKP